MISKLYLIISILVINTSVILYNCDSFESLVSVLPIVNNKSALHNIGTTILGIFISKYLLMKRAKQRLELIKNQLAPLSGDELQYIVATGSKFTDDYRIYYKNVKTGKLGSFFHDIDFELDEDTRTVNMVVEIPRWTNAKMEISKDVRLNPIMQDKKKGKLRFVHNVFPFHGYIHNYGAIPQTWEDCTHVDEDAENLYGDNDPLDVCDIGSSLTQPGEIVRVKVLGALALIDDGELDWKVIAINLNDPLSEKINDISDVNKFMPNVLESTRNWFKNYKIPDGKPQNKFGFNGEYKNSEFALEVIRKTHNAWKQLINGKIKANGVPVIENTSQRDTPGYQNNAEISLNLHQEDSNIPASVHSIFHLTQEINR